MASDGTPRLIEVAFPLKQASLDSVHEKNVRHGHISTLHIWPARRPLAACRAALIATLLPDPGNDADRQRLLERLAGKVLTKNTTKRVGGRDVPVVKEETVGGILHWGRENGPDLEFFREEIRKVYGRPPRVLDPFAGGGAIPLEAMRLGCEATAIDINPVAWFILKCTLEYPQRLAGQTRPLPDFALESPEFMAAFLKQTGKKKGRQLKDQSQQTSMLEAPEADLAWHVRAWGHWVLQRARADLERFYPTVDGKPTVAYLWARTVTCKNCRATLPLLKTLWLCRKEKKRFRLAMKPRADRSGVDFQVAEEPKVGGNTAQQREHDRRVGQGTMSRSGAWCPVCGGPGTVAMTLDDIRAKGLAGRLGAQMTAVVVDGSRGKDYRLPTSEELAVADEASERVEDIFKDIPFGLPTEPLPTKEALGFRVPLYGIDQWYKLFTTRQLVALGTFVKHTRAARDAMLSDGYPPEWVEAVVAYLTANLSKAVHLACTLCTWHVGNEQIRQVFSRYALPITWDFAESAPPGQHAGSYLSMLESTVAAVRTSLRAASTSSITPKARCQSALLPNATEELDVVVTDPPYYDAIPYSDAMDFFYIWLRRTLAGISPEMDTAFSETLGPKWDHQRQDGELIDDASRFGGDAEESRAAYEGGMFRAFRVCQDLLTPQGVLVVVFANKQPNAWETLVSSIVRAGFVVDGSWPIQTELSSRTRALTSAALASSVWLVCRKRPETARPGWDSQVLQEMRARIYDRLRDFWDAGIRGPDFVWAATGPALEAYSKHPVVKKADEPNAVLTVSEFLHHVRRIVVDYVVGRVLSRDGESEEAAALDTATIYYLLHRHDFGFTEAPVGACILYAQSCNLRDRDLADRYDLVSFTSGKAVEEEEELEGEEAEEEEEERGSGSKMRLKRWDQRRGKSLGLDAEGWPAPLIDQVHRIMRLWREGDVRKVDDYIEERGLRRNPLFPRLLQALVELARKDNQAEERTLLETIMNHVTARGEHPQMRLLEVHEEP
jgi:putative DNA methylase